MRRPVIIFIIAALCSLVVSWQAYIYTRGWGLVQIHQHGSSRLLDTISALRVAIDQYRYLPFLLSQNRDVKDLLVQSNPSKVIKVSRYLEQTNLVAGSAALIVLDLKGEVVAYSNWRERGATARRYYQNAPFFLQALSGEQGRYFMVDDSATQPSYYLSAPIYHRQQLIGVSVMKLDVSALKEQLSLEYAFYVADQHGQLLFTSLALLQEAGLPRSGLKSFGVSGSEFKTSASAWSHGSVIDEKLFDDRDISIWKLDGKEQLNESVMLDDLKWEVGVLSPIKAAEQRAVYAGFTVAGGCLAFALLVLYLREYRLKRRSQALVLRAQRDSEQRQRYIINTAQVGLITVDKQGVIVFVNPMVMQQFGVSLSLIMGRPLAALFADIDQFTPLKRWLEGLSHGEFTPITGYEVVGRRSDGSVFPVLFSIRMMTAAPQVSYLVTMIDITRRKRLEYKLREVNESLETKVLQRTQALEAAQNELIQAEKLAALGRMSTAMVHELNQPLTAMRNYLAIIRRLSDQPGLQNENLNRVNGLVDKMALITGQLKTFAYKSAGASGLVELVFSIQHILGQYKERFVEQSIDCSFEHELTCYWVHGDEIRIEQVLVNLITNACDAMLQLPSGQISMTLRLLDNDRQSIDQDLESPCHDWVVLNIRDTGEGATDEQLAHMFEPFYTTKSMGDGLGLGLPIVQGIVRDLGGIVDVVRNQEQGLCFSVSLPLAKNTGGI
ncbi:sensor histidine kinase [Neptunomonas japonica]|uniref:histidine kinase n=1 Tax=Neptunomonas japonica JAMM 1380 TaxID=1441457 RepID=A0A7R6PL56_9GAMM|nr:ATP-binding protein [Neptunomonas japonica]BBB30236.1 two-component system sensor histidine kinase [Neptunomonas japonica JAMM 1380]